MTPLDAIPLCIFLASRTAKLFAPKKEAPKKGFKLLSISASDGLVDSDEDEEEENENEIVSKPPGTSLFNNLIHAMLMNILPDDGEESFPYMLFGMKLKEKKFADAACYLINCIFKFCLFFFFFFLKFTIHHWKLQS